MNTVVSATTRFARRPQIKHIQMISRASVLLRDASWAYRAGNYSDAVEFSYQAALRTAGAYVAASPIAKRKRLPRSAWDQLSLVDGAGKGWARQFARFSQLRSRLLTGLEVDFEPVDALRLLNLSEQFLDFVESVGLETTVAA
ncbi:SAV_6107 family HEPN domain-containing protein [Corynebacterium epidermidicanis]|uniref:SAV-6107-like HEPN domain-containing protein n=1 Tax=Corynebacterium epidermidicanis TaxID=1050174 RepID=A0A0G3GXD8_9CORY|nr:SAV_6107 family HEPN domain-containing protein [Corynebacterium epidermidicanis]AKK03532.1 hypothetical protein CEPID_08410 [Corynebacterium epidermidicanis]